MCSLCSLYLYVLAIELHLLNDGLTVESGHFIFVRVDIPGQSFALQNLLSPSEPTIPELSFPLNKIDYGTV